MRWFSSWGNGVPNITFNTAAGVPITSRAVGTLKFLAKNVHPNVRFGALEHAYYNPNQPRNGKSKQEVEWWQSPDFSNCTWVDVGIGFQFSYDNRDCFWKILPLPLMGFATVDGVVTDCVIAVTRSSATLQHSRLLRPTGHPKRGQHVPAAIPQDRVQCDLSPVVAGFHGKHGVPIGGLELPES